MRKLIFLFSILIFSQKFPILLQANDDKGKVEYYDYKCDEEPPPEYFIENKIIYKNSPKIIEDDDITKWYYSHDENSYIIVDNNEERVFALYMIKYYGDNNTEWFPNEYRMSKREWKLWRDFRDREKIPKDANNRLKILFRIVFLINIIVVLIAIYRVKSYKER